MLLAFSIVMAFSATYAKNSSKIVGGAIIATLFVFFGLYDIASTPLSHAYPIEILPYRLRARGMSGTLMTVLAAGVVRDFLMFHLDSLADVILGFSTSISIRRSCCVGVEVLFRLY
jgi:hypothetical protein